MDGTGFDDRVSVRKTDTQAREDFANSLSAADKVVPAFTVAEDPNRAVPAQSDRPLKIVFGLMSAVATVATVEQLVAALQPHWVVVHHDFSQQPDFKVRAENARLVPDPKRTGYGVWAFTEGVIHLLDYCLKHVDFDYFQLLSPACLPIRPLAEFEASLTSSAFDVNAEFIDLRTNPDAMMTYGHRAYGPYKSWRRALLRQARQLYFGRNATAEPFAGVQIMHGSNDLKRAPFAMAGYALTRLAALGWLGSYRAAPGLDPKVGAAWIGAKREVCDYLVRRLKEPTLYEHYRRFNDIAEISFQTLLGHSNFRIGPLNTFVNAYDGWHPHVFESCDLDQLAHLPHFFARKFPDDPDAPVRRRVLEWVRGC
jgi:hypothetical protein